MLTIPAIGALLGSKNFYFVLVWVLTFGYVGYLVYRITFSNWDLVFGAVHLCMDHFLWVTQPWQLIE